MTSIQDTDTSIFVRLLNLLDAIRGMSPFSDLSADEEQLLGQLVLRWQREEQFTVGDVMQSSDRASPSTIYRRLIALRDKGLADLCIDESDRRVKFIQPTPLAHEYVRNFSVHLDALIARERTP